MTQTNNQQQPTTSSPVLDCTIGTFACTFPNASLPTRLRCHGFLKKRPVGHEFGAVIRISFPQWYTCIAGQPAR
jgi:hypothetical protein